MAKEDCAYTLGMAFTVLKIFDVEVMLNGEGFKQRSETA